MGVVYAACARRATPARKIGAMAIHLSEYSDTWINDFMQIAGTLVDALNGRGGQGIEHIGSTAVPGLVSRPIIDIAVIAAPLAMQEAASTLESIGYVRMQPKDRQDHGDHSTSTTSSFDEAGAVPDPVRALELDVKEINFRAPNTTALHSLTLFDEESLLLHASVAIRQQLMENSDLKAEFAGYKRGLAFTNAIDVHDYRAAKTPMFATILKEAGMDEGQIALITAAYG